MPAVFRACCGFFFVGAVGRIDFSVLALVVGVSVAFGVCALRLAISVVEKRVEWRGGDASSRALLRIRNEEKSKNLGGRAASVAFAPAAGCV